MIVEKDRKQGARCKMLAEANKVHMHRIKDLTVENQKLSEKNIEIEKDHLECSRKLKEALGMVQRAFFL